MNDEIRDMLLSYINNKKITKDFKLDERDLIYETLDIHTHFDKENETILLYSTDIFPETIRAFKKTFVLFDVHYIKYIECFYSNLLFIISELKSNSKRNLSDLKSIIKSDLFHFLAVRNYNNPVASLTFLKQSEIYFKRIDLRLELQPDQIIFFQAVNLYLIRHEIAHTHFRNSSSKKAKDNLKIKLLYILKLTKDGRFDKTDIDLSKFSNNIKRLDNKLTIESIERIINEEKIDFEEIFCDYIAFLDTMIILDNIYPNANLENKHRFHLKLVEHLSVFDYLNQIFRHASFKVECILKDKEVTELKPMQLIRHSIGLPLRILILTEIDPIDIVKRLQKDDTNFDSIDIFQDVIFEYIYKTVAELNQNNQLLEFIINSDLPIEIAAKERDRLLKW